MQKWEMYCARKVKEHFSFLLRSFTIPDTEALSPSDPLRHAGYNEEETFDGTNPLAMVPMADGELDANGDPKSRILSKTNPRCVSNCTIAI